MSEQQWAELLERLGAPFPKEAFIEDKSRGFVLTGIKTAYIIERLNEVFGPCGAGWAISMPDFVVTEKSVTARFGLKYYTNGEWSEPIPTVGDSNIVRGRVGDAQKGAVSDGIKKAASFLGVAMDIYKGRPEDATISGSEKATKLKGAKKPKPETEKPKKEPKPSQEKGPGAVKVYLNEQAFEIGSSAPSEPQLKLYRLLLDKIFDGDTLKRRTWQKWTFNKESSTDMTKGQVQATLKMLKLEKDEETGCHEPTSEKAIEAIKAMFKQALVDAGQTEMSFEQSVEELYGS